MSDPVFLHFDFTTPSLQHPPLWLPTPHTLPPHSSAHGIPISFVTETLHSDYYSKDDTTDTDNTDDEDDTTSSTRVQTSGSCAREIQDVCGEASSGCVQCVNTNAPLKKFPSCPGGCTDIVPGAVASCVALCQGSSAHDLGTVYVKFKFKWGSALC